MCRRSRNLPYALVAIMLMFAAACSDQSTAPPAPPEVTNPSLLTYPTPCSKDSINALVNLVFTRPLVRAAVKVDIALFFALNQSGAKPAARAKLLQIIDKALEASVGVSDPVALRRIQSFVGLLYCVLGESPPTPIDLVNGGAQVVNPGETVVVGAPDLVNGGNNAATEVKGVAVPTLVSITPCVGGLDTPLEQKGPCYDITASPTPPAVPRLVGVCIDLFTGDDSPKNARVRLAHNLDPVNPVTEGNIRFGNIEIISPGPSLAPLGLSCVPGLTLLDKVADWLLPQKLFAGGQGTGGRGGLVSNYSPFSGVVVEQLTFGLPNWLFQQPSTGNPTIPSSVQAGQTVPFFAAGGATTPSNGAIWQGTWTFGLAPFGDTKSPFGPPSEGDVSFASPCNGDGGTVNYLLGTATLWSRSSVGATTDPSLFTYLYARRVFYSANTTDPIRLALDNDIRVWINGTEVTSYTVGGVPVTVAAGDFLAKEGCAGANQVQITVPRTGVNVISVQARDRGVASYFDASQQANNF